MAALGVSVAAAFPKGTLLILVGTIPTPGRQGVLSGHFFRMRMSPSFHVNLFRSDGAGRSFGLLLGINRSFGRSGTIGHFQDCLARAACTSPAATSPEVVTMTWSETRTWPESLACRRSSLLSHNCSCNRTKLREVAPFWPNVGPLMHDAAPRLPPI